MAQQIQDLVASIRKDGIEAAQKEASQLIADAKAQADEIVSSGRKRASQLIDEAQKEIDVRDQSARASLHQASRDVQLSLKKAIQAQLDLLLVEKIEKAFDSDAVVALIGTIVERLSDGAAKEVQLSEKDFKKLAASLKSALSDKIKEGLEIKAVPTVTTGFRIAEKDGSGFYDFSAEETASLMAPFLSPAIAEIVFAQTK
ncbi:V-type ATP synthase subunit E [Sphaerochaeta sp. PS]|uniref:V-type ATP synthase subunit E n=1 Tax=Sphaerochaeta sp. PS TaxID=3076336 RepID=UPI0028A4CEE4|nr:V-type ATP synthase subunit E [Sphaerochaeta sp. PS]MDT4761551.1 V-type ATP synthase subunit E [Sphaerochaeta sp. PS]